MKRLFFFLGLLPFMTVMAQRKAVPKAEVVPLRAANWEFRQGTVEFADSAGEPAMKIIGDGLVVLKDTDFSDGTIEFDDVLGEKGFAAFYFRWQDTLENENFYFRVPVGAGHPYAIQGVQYAPTIKGVNCWDLMYHYQTGARYDVGTPSHVRLVINGRQMRVYVNSQQLPTLEVPRLEGNTTHGTLAFSGSRVVSHLVLRPGQTGDLAGAEGLDPTATDTRYLRRWQVTGVDTMPAGVDFSLSMMPGKETKWTPIMAERRGLVNLTRLYGGNPSNRNQPRRICWLRTTIHADSARLANLRMGFVDDVWIFLNGAWLYADKNHYGEPIAKKPAGRLSLDNAQVTMPLRKGDNELLVGIECNFWGWGFAARLDDLDGVGLER
ncbi:MAG: hypothetical protein JST42_16095 [Bacteroidetes bacterium]|nr:hypothetical protein [Bacteroidota bacterium]